MFANRPRVLIALSSAVLAAAAVLVATLLVLLIAPAAPTASAVVPLVAVSASAPPPPETPPAAQQTPSEAPEPSQATVTLAQTDSHGVPVPWAGSAVDGEITLRASAPEGFADSTVTIEITRHDGRTYSREVPLEGGSAEVIAQPLPPGRYTWRAHFPSRPGAAAERPRSSPEDFDFQVPQPELHLLDIDQYAANGRLERLTLGTQTDQTVVIAAVVDRDEATLFVEVQPTAEEFRETGVCSEAVREQLAVVSLSLPAGSYKWRWRVQPAEAATASWQEFGDNGNDPDFVIFRRPAETAAEQQPAAPVKPPAGTESGPVWDRGDNGFSGVSSGVGERQPFPPEPRTLPPLWSLLTSTRLLLGGTGVLSAALTVAVFARARRVHGRSHHV